MNTKRSRPFTKHIFFTLALLIVVVFAMGIAGKVAQADAKSSSAAPEVMNYLETRFCRDSLCEPGDWQTWIILEPGSLWSVEELEEVRETLLTTIRALDEAGFDGKALLSGTRFRRHHAEFVDGVAGRIARIYHESGEIALADTAFIRLWGWYPYHELGHVIDRRLGSEPRRYFHAAIGSTSSPGNEKTTDGYWMNEHAKFDFGEAAADAIALWIVRRYSDHPNPVFWLMPNDTDYEKIAGTMEEVLWALGGR